LSSYQKVYDEFLAAYRRVEERYKAFARRKKPEAEIPLRIEIDQFFSYIREIFAKEESYGQQPIRTGNDLGANLDQHLGLWFDTDWAYLDEVMVSYARINQVLGSSDSIQRADAHELFDALTVCHSVYDRRRFFAGGLSTFRDEFVRQNDIVKVRSTLTFLVHGQGDFVERMATCIFDEDFKLKQFGRSAVQETYGWVNKENVPICNGRTVKSLRWLGFNVLIFN